MKTEKPIIVRKLLLKVCVAVESSGETYARNRVRPIDRHNRFHCRSA